MRYWNARSVHGDDDAGAVRGLSLGVYEYDAVNAAVSPLAARFGREHGAGPDVRTAEQVRSSSDAGS